MGIVLKWNFKSQFANIPRLVLTLLSIAGVFAILIAMGLSLESQIIALGSLHGDNSLSNFVISLLRPLTLIVFAVAVFVLFWVTLEERKKQYFLMCSSGATVRQLVWGLLTEAAALDVCGALPGIGFGFFMARISLRESDIALHPAVFFSRQMLLYSILPAALIPIVVILFCSIIFFNQKNLRQEKASRKKRKEVFANRGLSRRFGVGGTLENALCKQHYRSRLILIIAITANLTALFVLTAGSALLSDMHSIEECDMHLEVNSYAEDDAANGLNSEGLRTYLNNRMDQYKQNELIEDYAHISEYLTFCAVIEDSDLSREAKVAYAEDRKGNGFSTLYRLNDTTHIDSMSAIYVFDDAFFDRFVKDNEITYNGSGAILYNRGNINGRLIPVVDSLPKNGITLYRSDDVFLSGDDAEKLIESGTGIHFEIGGFFNAWAGDTSLMKYSALLIKGSVIVPQRQFADFAAEMESPDASCYDDYYIHTPDTTELYASLQNDLDGKYGFQIKKRTFGEGSAFQQQRTANILVFDFQTEQSAYLVFYSQIEQLYTLFVVIFFVLIALNIVNIVHMNSLSRRREYAVLISLGLNDKQKTGMLLYDSFRITCSVFLAGGVSLVGVSWLIYQLYLKVFVYDKMFPASLKFLTAGELSFADSLLKVVRVVFAYLQPYWFILVFTVMFLFCGFALTRCLALRRMEKDELVIIIKDDIL